MVFQNYALYPHMTVFENMAFALKLRKTPHNRTIAGYLASQAVANSANRSRTACSDRAV
jgi:ABC-type sugar transport system ATPase subunit